MKAILVAIKEHEGRRLESDNLPRQLRSYGATSAADQHPLARDKVSNWLDIESNRGTIEQVLDGQRADFVDRDATVEDVPEVR